jgi:beta-barrel assembly-enhancing protease
VDYENPKIPEGINVSPTHPLVDFGTMLIAVSGLLVLLIGALFLFSGWVVKYIPFEAETTLAALYIDNTPTTYCSDASPEIERKLQQLVDKLAIAQGVDKDITLSLHFSETSEINAMATIGGHIYMFKGLLDKLPNENALSMVLAHEIAHVNQRDPIIASGRMATLMLILTLVPGISDLGADQYFSQITTMTAMSFSRDQEQEADQAALETLQVYYGHTNGAQDLFKVLSQHAAHTPPMFLSTHPLTNERITAVEKFQANKHTGAVKPGLVDEFIRDSNPGCK